MNEARKVIPARRTRYSECDKGAATCVFDITVATVALALLSPLLAMLMLVIKATSPGPVLFRQTRVGRDGRLFAIIKLRTMALRAGAGGDGVTVGDDGRVTPIGRFLRKSKMDELPQLINVLRGEMSLVGPRPELPAYVAKYSDDDKRIVLSVAPGITDFASIRFRNESDLLARQSDPARYYEQVVMPAKLRYCRFYVKRARLALDLYVLLQTVGVLVADLFAGAGAPARRRARVVRRPRRSAASF